MKLLIYGRILQFLRIWKCNLYCSARRACSVNETCSLFDAMYRYWHSICIDCYCIGTDSASLFVSFIDFNQIDAAMWVRFCQIVNIFKSRWGSNRSTSKWNKTKCTHTLNTLSTHTDGNFVVDFNLHWRFRMKSEFLTTC